MNPTHPFLILAIVACLANLTFTAAIIGELQKRGVYVRWWLLRFLLPKYIEQYKQLTKQETGMPGPFYNPWLISINLVWILLLCAIGMKLWCQPLDLSAQ